MAFNLTALGNYTKESIEPLLMSAITSGKTQDLLLKSGTVLTGVKGPQKMPIFDTDAVFQVDACGWNPSGTTTVSQRDITVGKIKIEEAICPKDLETKFTSLMLAKGSTYETLGDAGLEAAYLERKNQKISDQLEKAIWQGDTASGNPLLNKFDGLMKLIDAASPISANTGALSGTVNVTAANALSILTAVKNKIPAALQGQTDLTLFMGYDMYNYVVDAGIAANQFHWDWNDKSNYGGLMIPGTGLKIEAVHGLDGTGDIYATRLSNTFLAVDAEGEEDNYQLWYSKDNNEIRFRVAFKMGVNVAFASEVVVFKGVIS